MSHLFNLVPHCDQRKVVGSTVHDKEIRVMAEAERKRLYFSQKKVNMVEEVAGNVYQQITKQRQKQFYIISGYKSPDGSVKRASIHIKSVVVGLVLVLVSVNISATASLLRTTATTIIPENPSTTFPVYPSTPVDPVIVSTTTNSTYAPALLSTSTTVPANRTNTVSPAPDPTITTNVPSNPPTHVALEPDTTITTSVYANLHNQYAPVPDLTSPPTHVAPVPDTPSPIISNHTVVDDCRGLKWYDSEDVIDLY